MGVRFVGPKLTDKMTPIIAFALLTVNCCETAKILGFLPFKGKSHNIIIQPVFEALAKRGHDVHVLSYFPRNEPLKNYTSMSLVTDSNEKLKGFFNFKDMIEGSTVVRGIKLIWDLQDAMHVVFRSPYIDLIKKDKYDVIITEYFNSDMFMDLIKQLKTPYILIHTSEPLPHHRLAAGDPLQPSYIQHAYSSHPSPMSYTERLINTLEIYGSVLTFRYLFGSSAQVRAETYARGHLPRLNDLARDASLTLLNVHFSFQGLRPINPSTIEVGGLHLKPKKPLPQDFQKIMDESKHGVIYFSMGSVLDGSTIDVDTRKALGNVFSRLNQTIFWKFEGEFSKKSANLHVSPWFPQRDLLGHENVVLFISHCGLLSVEEAVDEGVPMICIPMFADQFFNSRAVETHGMGKTLNYWHMTESEIEEAVTAVLSDPSFKKNAQRVSEVFHDRPMSPLDTACYWVEYVVRHRGAPHLQSPAKHLHWHQLENLDVWATLFMCVCALLYTLVQLSMALFMCLPSKSKRKSD